MNVGDGEKKKKEVSKLQKLKGETMCLNADRLFFGFGEDKVDKEAALHYYERAS